MSHTVSSDTIDKPLETVFTPKTNRTDLDQPDHESALPLWETPEHIENLAELIRLWKIPATKKSLHHRHRIGVLALALLKPTTGPNARQPYREKIARLLARRIGCAHCTLTRHRQYAERYESVADYYRRHPGVYTWKEIYKNILPNNA